MPARGVSSPLKNCSWPLGGRSFLEESGPGAPRTGYRVFQRAARDVKREKDLLTYIAHINVNTWIR